MLEESIALSKLLDSMQPSMHSMAMDETTEEQQYSEHVAEILQSFLHMKGKELMLQSLSYFTM